MKTILLGTEVEKDVVVDKHGFVWSDRGMFGGFSEVASGGGKIEFKILCVPITDAVRKGVNLVCEIFMDLLFEPRFIDYAIERFNIPDE